MALSEGEVFAGYTILRPLGAGGMGEVYLAQHPRLPRREALKVLRPDVSTEDTFQQRFIREADSIAALEHPHIVTVHDRGETDGQLWIATQYVDGTDAAKLLRDRYPAGMPADEASLITTAIAEALDYAHDRGLLHRDVKPANILLTDPDRNGHRRVYLADFGIARPLDDPSGLTSTNFTLGTFAYAAPEQLAGKSMDGRADQYALAATAYHLLTGTPLFSDSNPVAVISQHLTEPPPNPSAINANLAPFDAAFAKALAKSPDKRFTQCRDFARALTDASRHSGFSAAANTQHAPIPPGGTGNTAPSRRAKTFGLLIPGLLVGVTLGGALLWRPWVGDDQASPSTASSQTAPTSGIQPTPASSNATTPPTPVRLPRLTASPPAVVKPTVACGVDNDAAQVRAAMASLSGPGEFGEGGLNQAEGNFDPCATLSTVLVYLYGAAGSSPVNALLFHNGQYVGTATPNAYAYMNLNTEQTTDSTVVLNFRLTAGSCGACNDASYVPVKFRWTGDRVEMVGVPPDKYRAGS